MKPYEQKEEERGGEWVSEWVGDREIERGKLGETEEKIVNNKQWRFYFLGEKRVLI